MLAPLATVGAFSTVRSRLTNQLRIHGFEGNIAVYQLPGQNALHNETRAVRRKGPGVRAPVVTGRAQGRTA